MTAFDDCLDGFTWLPEWDGQPYHSTPGDPGGGTAWGVTQHTWAAWAALHTGLPTSVARATQEALRELLYAWFWSGAGCLLLPAGVQLMVWDFGVTAGPGTAVHQLQTQLGVTVDGQVGPKTAAAAAVDPVALCKALHNTSEDYYASLGGEVEFQGGWYRRTDARLAMALTMISAGAAASPNS